MPATLSIEKQLDELHDALAGSTISMEHSDTANALKGLYKYVGAQDTVHIALSAEFEIKAQALSNKAQALSNKEKSDQYGLSQIVSADENPEVPLALAVAYFERCGDEPSKSFTRYWEELQSPVNRAKIAVRFPHMTRERMDKALERARPLIQAQPA